MRAVSVDIAVLWLMIESFGWALTRDEENNVEVYNITSRAVRMISSSTPSDRLLRFRHHQRISSSEELLRYIRKRQPGGMIKVEFVRQGKREEDQVKERPRAAMKRAVVLSSGGLDSTVAAAEARAAGYQLFLLSVNYGQRHEVELTRVPAIAKALGAVRTLEITVDLRAIGGSALTDVMVVPKDRTGEEIGAGIPPTYVPARNTLFLALALGWAEVLLADTIYIGANILDYSGYPDCRPEFLTAFEALARVGTKAGIEGRDLRVEAPLLRMTKADIIRRGIALKAPLELTHSCYDPDQQGRACGCCDSCLLRRKGFAEAGVSDSVIYRSAASRC